MPAGEYRTLGNIRSKLLELARKYDVPAGTYVGGIRFLEKKLEDQDKELRLLRDEENELKAEIEKLRETQELRSYIDQNGEHLKELGRLNDLLKGIYEISQEGTAIRELCNEALRYGGKDASKS